MARELDQAARKPPPAPALPPEDDGAGPAVDVAAALAQLRQGVSRLEATLRRAPMNAPQPGGYAFQLFRCARRCSPSVPFWLC